MEQIINKDGILDQRYHTARLTKKPLQYRLKRRGDEVLGAIKKYAAANTFSLLDIGTADGLMLDRIKKTFPKANCFGLEYSFTLLKTNTNEQINLINADANHLPLKNSSVDIVTAIAVIEHLQNPAAVLNEIKRILKPKGLIVITSPDPFWEKIATLLGHLPNEQHFQVLGRKKIISLLNSFNFTICAYDKFMLSPIGLPYELMVEKYMKKIKLSFLLANQLIIAKQQEYQ